MKIFPTLTFALFAFAIPLKRTVDQVKADITEISNQVKALGSAISSFPDSGGTLQQALEIHSSAQNLVSTINTATSDVNGTPTFSEDDSKDILNLFQGLAPDVSSTLQALVSKKPAFDALPLGQASALVKQDLGQLADATKSLESALIDKAPDDLKGQAQQVAEGINSDITSAQSAYA
ncbi:hypothetical protein V5O48_004210 [Marasmius crinis-equi]|uniref:Hydrophobic surface binding protein n=1 Tax=Marasmius crinis-equi TaxID=585013 RepID=A0ABR3FQU5_9AGAR